MKLKKEYDKKRFELVDNDFQLYIKDTHQTEDFHEGDLTDIYELVHKLNELYCENRQYIHLIKKLEDALHNKNLFNLSVLGQYSKEYKRDSDEFNLIADIGKDLGVTVSLLEAYDD